jgi:Tol biopolymer transport system component
MRTGRTLAVITLVAFTSVPGIAQRAQPNAVSRDDAEVMLQAAMHKEQVEGRLPEAIDAYKSVVAKAGSNKRVAAQALLQLAASYEKLGRPEARATYQAIVREYPDQPTAVAAARARLGAVRSARGQEEITPRRVLDGDPVELIEVSEDGRLALGREIAGLNSINLVVRDPSSGRMATLLRGTQAASWFQPRFSRDGQRVAYRWEEGPMDRRQGSLRAIGTESGATPEIILPQITGRTNPNGWSPDGRAILLSLTPQELAWVSVEDKSVRTIKTFEKWQEVYDASVSPDGRFIAYSAKPVSGSNDKYIYIIDANGQRETAVVKTAGSRGWPFWRPDGTQLFFRGDRGIPGGSALWSIGIRDGEAVGEPWIVKEGFTETPIGFTSSGSLFYTRSTFSLPYQFLIHRNPAQGESALAFVGQAASWSPDGRSLAFIRGNATGAPELIIRSVETGAERSHQHPGIPVTTPRWLHDGSGVIVQINAQVDGRPTTAFHVVDVRTGTFRRLFDRAVNGRERTGVGAVSPDDKTLYLGARNSTGGNITEIVGVDLATGIERPIFTLPGAGLPAGWGVAVSPDGTTLAVMASTGARSISTGEARIFTVGADGSNYREVFGPFASGGFIPDKMRWTPDGRTLVFVDFDANRNWRLMRVPAVGGKAEFDGLDFDTLAPRIAGHRMIPGTLWNLDLSPDGSRALVSTQTLGTHELWALDNLPSVASSR